MRSVTLKWSEQVFCQTNYDPMFTREDKSKEDVVETIQCDMASQAINHLEAG